MKNIWRNILIIVFAVCFVVSGAMLAVELKERAGKPLPEYAPDAYVQELLGLINEEREANGLEPMALDVRVSKLAYVRAQEAAQQWSHTRPNGEEASSVYEEHGITRDFWTGENLARSPDRDARLIVDAWMASEAHRKNILNPLYTAAGMAVYWTGEEYYIANLFRS